MTVPDRVSVSPSVGVSPAERERVEQALRARRAPSTLDAYRRRWDRFVRWCDGRGASPLPADPSLVAVYVTGLADAGLTISTIEGSLSAIRHRHVEAGVPDPTASAGVAAVRSGLRREVGTAPKHPSRPLTVEELRLIISAMASAPSLRASRDRAILLLGFAGAFRRSEIGALCVGDLDWRRDGLVVTVRRSKGDQEGRGEVVGVTRGSHHATDPVAAVRDWLDLSGRLAEPCQPLFSPIAWSDRRPLEQPLTGRAICRIVQARGDAVGVLGLTGHSLRSGHATAAAEAGVGAERIARTTRHASLASLQRYLRPAQVLSDSTSSTLGP